MKDVTIDLDIYGFLVSMGLGTTQTASEILRQELVRTISIDDDLYTYILSLGAAGESISATLRRLLPLSGGQNNPGSDGNTDGSGDATGQIIEFHIKAGTDHGAWNTPATKVVGGTGQTLRIFNDDSVPHQLHTGGAPFPHEAAPIAPNASADFVLQQPIAVPAGSPQTFPVYDHLYGPTAIFWIEVTSAT